MTIRWPSVPWTRRHWLTQTTAHTVAAATLAPQLRYLSSWVPRPLPDATLDDAHGIIDAATVRRMTAQAARLEPGPLQTLALQAVDAARQAGAQYADARLTRTVVHNYMLGGDGSFSRGSEALGVGVRVLIDGYWGFAASPDWEPDAVVRLAYDAVAQARENAKGPARVVELGQIPVVAGTWATPVTIDPFVVPIEEKLDHIVYWKSCARRDGLVFVQDGMGDWMQFARQERVVATSEGALFDQTVYESGGKIDVAPGNVSLQDQGKLGVAVQGIGVAAKGWELFLEAKIPEQFDQSLQAAIQRKQAAGTRPVTIGRYTLVCDGATMASLVERTIGIATQLDRALGYEANAGGTSFIDDPLAMVGHLPVASPHVTVTANRSAPAQLATVKWDDEGIEPPTITLVKDGILTDFQTTREQAAWLTPYYQHMGRPVRSNGCAAAEDALSIPMQHMPNVALEPGTQAVSVEDLIADVPDGILIEGGTTQCDFQARNGLLHGVMHRIQNGRLGTALEGGAVQFNTGNLWKQVQALGGPQTRMVQGASQFAFEGLDPSAKLRKGQPPQAASHSMSGVGALILNQAVIDPDRKA